MFAALNRGPDEWLSMFADPMRAQSAIDRLTGNAYDLVIEGESYRQRLKPRLSAQPTRTRSSRREADSTANTSTS
jgi:DNA replication protein DnaC